MTKGQDNNFSKEGEGERVHTPGLKKQTAQVLYTVIVF